MRKQTADKIITQYMRKIYGFAIKRTFSYDEAEDLCAEIVKEVYSALLGADGIVNIEGYIWRISEHTFAKYVSLKKRHEGLSIDGMDIPFYDNSDDFTAGFCDEELGRLCREIAFLTEKRRKIVFSFYYQGESVSKIAGEMGIPQGTVKWHLSKARNELKEGFSMERKVGKLGLSPVNAVSFGHSGNPGNDGAPEFYLSDSLSLNIVYSVYNQPRTSQEIAEELGVTPVFLQKKIDFLESNGFLVRIGGHRYTTYVEFTPAQYSLEREGAKRALQMQVAQTLVKEYVPAVRKAVDKITDVWIPGKNRALFEAAAIFWAVSEKCQIQSKKDLSKYRIKTTSGADYIAKVWIESKPSDPDYRTDWSKDDWGVCGSMTRESYKYPAVTSWSTDSRFDSRIGGWKNNLTSDYEYLYEYICGMLGKMPADSDAPSANTEKFSRLRERGFIAKDGSVSIMVVRQSRDDFFTALPALDDEIKARFADKALEFASLDARDYPPQMQDLVIARGVGWFISDDVAMMVLDILYKDGILKPLSDAERVAANLLMFSDRLPE